MNLKNIRIKNNYSQLSISKLLNVSRCTYAIWENEINPIPLQRLITFCDIFNISVDYALGLTNNQNYPNMKKNIDRTTCSKRLKEIRKENSYTQDRLAKKLNTDNGVISRYEHSETLILTSFLKEYATIFNISCDYLLGRIDKKIKIKEPIAS